MKEEKWYFTFGYGCLLYNHYIIIKGSYNEAREKIYKQFNQCWSSQYSETKWNNETNHCKHYKCIGEF